MALKKVISRENARALLPAHKYFLCLLLAAFGFAGTAGANLQFDIFFGYGGEQAVPEANWFPVGFEIKNDGPPVNAFIEIAPASFNRGQIRRIPVELPTGTLKRINVPVFATSRHSAWSIRLVDERRRVLAEELNFRPRRPVAWGTAIVGAVCRTAGGVPVLPAIKSNQTDFQPAVARILPALFPDNPIALEGLQALYLNSEVALELRPGQASAILTWLQSGGHLIVGVEQGADINANPWLREVLPVEFTGAVSIRPEDRLDQWLRTGAGPDVPRSMLLPRNVEVHGHSSDLATDGDFASGSLLVATGSMNAANVLAQTGGRPLIVEIRTGRGRLTLLTFSPEREPFLSWKNRPWFWAKLAGIPHVLFESTDFNRVGGWSVDAVFGTMIESKQIRKLPLQWLLLLLLCYLAVIGPVDHFWLKRINRQMLTWITFPCYVLFFSGLIYFIGFKLRAGESEWNELNIVDVLPNGSETVLRGRTFVSIYSPANLNYALIGKQPIAALRGEFLGSWGSTDEASQGNIILHGNNFEADVFVPVWTSQLFSSDWLQPSDTPLTLDARRDSAGWRVSIENHTGRSFSEAHLVLGGRIFTLEELPPGAKQVRFASSDGMPVADFVRQHGSGFYSAAQHRRQAFGSSDHNRFPNLAASAVAASFIAHANDRESAYERFIYQPNLDLTMFADANAILLAWAPGESPTPPMNQFKPRRSDRNTLLRVVAPIQ